MGIVAVGVLVASLVFGGGVDYVSAYDNVDEKNPSKDYIVILSHRWDKHPNVCISNNSGFGNIEYDKIVNSTKEFSKKLNDYTNSTGWNFGYVRVVEETIEDCDIDVNIFKYSNDYKKSVKELFGKDVVESEKLEIIGYMQISEKDMKATIVLNGEYKPRFSSENNGLSFKVVDNWKQNSENQNYIHTDVLKSYKHELIHALGLGHTNECSGTTCYNDLMLPYLITNSEITSTNMNALVSIYRENGFDLPNPDIGKFSDEIIKCDETKDHHPTIKRNWKFFSLNDNKIYDEFKKIPGNPVTCPK